MPDTLDYLDLLEEDGCVGIYVDSEGDIVVQHDGTSPEVAASVAPHGKVETVPGGFVAQQDRTARYRPLPVGVSISAQDVTAGTSGVLVEKGDDGPFVDTNLHVAGGPTIETGEREDQPGEYDQLENGHDEYTEEEERFGELAWYVDPVVAPNRLSRLFGWILNYRRVGTEKPRYTITKTDVMRHDVGLVRPDSESVLDRSILGVDAYPDRIEGAPVGTVCQKAGRTTGVTELRKESDDWSGRVREPWGETMFVEQHLYRGVDGPGSKGGDSGSTILWDDWTAVDGRLFAGNRQNNVTIGNPYPDFADRYDVALWQGE